MEKFTRNDRFFSLCGLNCGLCTMHLGGYCPGCGGGSGNQPCAIARCSRRHGNLEYCFHCQEFPCEKYEGIDEYDSFITHHNQMNDIAKAQRMGLDAYHAEQNEKISILNLLLDEYNDGRRKTFFTLAVNLLELQDLREVMDKLALETSSTPNELPLTEKEKAALASALFQNMADKRGITLKLNKKPTKL